MKLLFGLEKYSQKGMEYSFDLCRLIKTNEKLIHDDRQLNESTSFNCKSLVNVTVK